MRRGLAAALLGLTGLLAACTSTVAGNGTIAADAAKPSGARPASPTPKPSAGSPGSSPGRRGALKCSGRVISPTGAPYCFSTPAGFQDVSSSVTVDASIGREKYRSAVAVADRDLIIVTVYELPVDTDGVTDAALEGELKKVIGQLSRQGFSFESTSADRGTVDGARSFQYHASQARTDLESDVYFLFRGRNEIQVNCQWRNKQDQIVRGCESVLDTLQFKSVK